MICTQNTARYHSIWSHSILEKYVINLPKLRKHLLLQDRIVSCASNPLLFVL